MTAAAPVDRGLPSPVAEPYALGLCCGALALLVLMATASLFVAGPQIEVDEGSYLLTAATLVGHLSASGVNGYYSGYSLMLLPAFLAGRDPTRIYHAALLINALLVATTPLALFRLTRLLYPATAPKWHTGAALAAACYAPLLLISQHAMSESALVPLYAWLLATGADAVLATRRSSAIRCGMLAGMLFLVHPRGGLMAAAVLVALSALCVPRTHLRRAMAALWIAALCIAALHMPLESLAGKPAGLGSSYNADSLVVRLLHPSTWPWIGVNGFGALTEAVVSSLGVVAIGLAALIMEIRAATKGDRGAVRPRTAILVAIVLGFATALAMSATFFIPPSRADHIAYGRYALPATIPLAAIGLLRFALEAPARRRDALLAMTAGIVSVAVLGAAFSRLPPATTTVWNFINAPMLYMAQNPRHFSEETGNAWWEIGACFLVLGGALYLAALASRTIGIVAFAALNLVIAAFAWQRVTWIGAQADAENRNVAITANTFGSVTGTPLCAELSRELQADAWIAIDMRWRALNGLADTRHGGAPPCAAASIEALNAAHLERVDRLIAVERRLPLKQASVGLFVAPGAALDAWKAKMGSLPRELLAPLPENDRHASVEVLSPAGAPRRIRVGDALAFDVRVTNAGTDSEWPESDAGPYPIRLGARSFDDSEVNAIGEYRARFARPLGPGESATLHIDIASFTHPGTYRVSIGVVQDGVAWFADTKDVIIEVSDR